MAGYGVNPDCCQLAVVNNTIKAGVSIDDDALSSSVHSRAQCPCSLAGTVHGARPVHERVPRVAAGSMWTYFRSRCYVSMSNLLFLFRKTSGLVNFFVVYGKKSPCIEGNETRRLTKLIWQPCCLLLFPYLPCH